eukprot:g3382.t1
MPLRTYALLFATTLLSCVMYAESVPSLTKYLPVPEECGDRLDFDDLNNKVCVQKLISKVLSLAIIAGAGILKVPQIVSIVANGNVKGLAESSFYLEAVSLTASVTYCWKNGFPLTTYFESVIINAQVFVLILLVWAYAKPKVSTGRKISAIFVYVACFLIMQRLPPSMQPALQIGGTVLNISSRLPQIISNFRNKSTGQLSLITWALNAVGGAARIFTTATEVDDLVVLAGFVLGFMTSAILVFQVVYYQYILKTKAE